MIYKPRIKRSNYLLVTTSIITSLLTCLAVFSSCKGVNIPTIAQYTLTLYSNLTMPVNENTTVGDGIYKEGTEVNIRAITETGWNSDEWTADISSMATDENTFVGTGTYKEGSKININASAETGWEFIEWTGDIDTITSRFSSNTDIVMNGNYEITAHFTYPVITHSISNVVFNPESSARLSFNEQVKIMFDYITNDKTAVYIFIHPFSEGFITPGYLLSGKRIYHPWQNEGDISFTISSQNNQIRVDQIRFQIMNIVQTKILYEIFVPVSYTFD